MMYKILLSLMTVVLFATSCLKNDSGCYFSPSEVVATQAEQDTLKAFLDSNSITATKDPSGFYYEIVTPGSGDAAPVLCSLITVTYVGKLTDGSKFDENTNVQFQLGTVIDGWKKGIPLIKKGGMIRLYIPPSLGYGSSDIKDNNGTILIPKNSILLFEVSLLDYTSGN